MEQIFLLPALRAAMMTALKLYGVCTTKQIWNIIMVSSEHAHGENEKYKKVFHILNRELKDQGRTGEILHEIAGYVIREDWRIQRILSKNIR